MFIIPAILSFLVLLWFLALILNSYPSISTGAKWGIFGGWISGAIIVGIICSVLRKIGLALIGGALGAFWFLLIYNSFLFATPPYILYIGMGAWSIVTAILAFTLFHQIIILTTAIIGSYLWVRGWSVFIGGFPN